MTTTDSGILMECTCSACPMQLEGTVDGFPAYFRARGEHYTFDIALSGGDAVSQSLSDSEGELSVYERWGDEPYAAGWMSEEEARALIAKHVAHWRELRAAREPLNTTKIQNRK